MSIMPLSLCKRINAEIKPTRMSLQLANRLVRFPVGVVEDLPVQIGKFYVPCDCVIMDIVEDHVIPIIPGRDFLKTARVVFDVFNGKLTLNILGEEAEFHLPLLMKGPADESLCRAEVARIEIMHPQYNDPSKSMLEGVEDGKCSEAASLKNLLDAPDFYIEPVMEIVLEAFVTVKQETSTPLQVDLKPLPSSVKYAYLGENETVNTELNNSQLDQLIALIKNFKSVIAYSIDDIIGKCPSFCMHKIFLDDDHTTSIEPQRRLKLNMKDVVRKEVQKLLNAGIIYHSSDSRWVSPVQVVPKK